MLSHLRANLWLLVLTVLICCVLYPAVLWGIGQTIFHDKAQGSLIVEDGKVIGSHLIGQPFTSAEYFQSRPSNAGSGNGYDARASSASNWGASNPLLRDRVARALGPIVKYQGPPSKKGQSVGPDIEAWFQEDTFQGKPGIVLQWANAFSSIAQNWVKSDKLYGDYLADWQKKHPKEVADWIKAHPENPEPKPEDLAVPFFESYSKENPKTFPSIVEHKTADGKTEKKVEPVKEGSDIQAGFFDMWLQENLWRHEQNPAKNPLVDLEKVPADMVMSSGSGLDPHITLENALYQLQNSDIAKKWAEKKKRDEAGVRKEIEELLHQEASAPLGGLVGVPLINVLEINRELRRRFGGG